LTNLLELFEEITSNVDGREPVDVLDLKIQKAFDNVLHQRLHQNKSSWCIGGNKRAWLEDWLANWERRARVRVGKM